MPTRNVQSVEVQYSYLTMTYLVLSFENYNVNLKGIFVI